MSQVAPTSDTVDVSTYPYLVRKRWVTVALCVVIGAAGGAAVLADKAAEWSSSASVLTSDAALGAGMLPDPAAGALTGQPLSPTVDTEAQLVLSDRVVRAVGDVLGGQLRDDEVRSAITVTAPQHTNIIRITVTASTAADARAAASTAANAYIRVRNARTVSLRDHVVDQLRLQATALRASIDELPSRGEVLRPSDPNQRRRALLLAARALTTRAEQIIDQGSASGELLSVTRATPARSEARTSPVVAGALSGLLIGLALSTTRRPRAGCHRARRWRRGVAQEETFKFLLQELGGPLVAPVVSVEACLTGPVTTEGPRLAEDLAARLTLVGIDSRFVTWGNQAPGGQATHEAALSAPAAVEGLRDLVLDAWLSHPTTDRVVVWTGSRLGTEELLTMPPAGVGSTDVVLLSRCADRSAVTDRLRRLRLLGARTHVVCVTCGTLLSTGQPPRSRQSRGEAVHVDT